MLGFLKESSIGIDISDSSVEVALLEHSAGASHVVHVGRVELRHGVVERGRIKDKNELARAVKKVFEIANISSTSARSIIFGLAESKTYIHIATIGASGGQEMEDLVEKEIRRVIPLEPQDTLYAYDVTKKDKNSSNVVIAAVSKIIFNEWKSFFESLSMPLFIIEPEIFAVQRGLFGDKDAQGSGVATIDCGSETTSFSFFQDGILVYSHTVPVGGNHFTRAIAEKMNISIAESESKKRSNGFSDANPQLLAILIKSFEPILLEIHSMIALQGSALKQIVCVGGSSKLPNFIEYIASNISIPVRIGEVDYVDILPARVDAAFDPLLYIEAIGLALRKWETRTPAFEVSPVGHVFTNIFPWRR